MTNLNEAPTKIRLPEPSRQAVQPLDLRSIAFKQSPEVTWKRLHMQGPIVTTRLPLLGRIALASDYESSQQVLRDTSQFSVDGRSGGFRQASGMRWWVPPMFRPLANNLLTLEGAEHRSLRQRVDYLFRRNALEQWQDGIHRLAQEAVDRLLHQITVSGEADFVSLVARPVPLQVISKMLGLHKPDTALQSPLNQALSQLGNIRRSVDLFRALPAIRVISKTLKSEIRQRQKIPRDDLLSLLVAESGDYQALSDDEILAMVFLLYVAGHETTTHLLSASVQLILTNPQVACQISEPLEAQSINEFIRFLSPVQMTKPRFVCKDINFHGAILKRGDTIAALIGAANRDERVFDEAHQFILTRSSGKHLGFGGGAHTCLGLYLALLETAITLNILLFSSPKLLISNKPDSVVWNQRLGLRALDRLVVTIRN
ncbi:MAG: cytochrome P450 [Granulosicoccus sp.]|nr:cytochrome P450 [Granulosicoccus sp.]